MSLSSLISVVTLAIISQNTNCRKSTEIEFINDFMKRNTSSLYFLDAFLCWEKAENLALITQLFDNNFQATVYNTDAAKLQIYSFARFVLYFLDLDCKNSFSLLEEANEKNMFSAPQNWLIISNNSDKFEQLEKLFVNFSIYPDNNVILAHKMNTKEYSLMEVYRYNKMAKYLIKNTVNNWIYKKGFNDTKAHTLALERRNLNGTRLNSSIVILVNDTRNHLDDYRFKHVDSITKVNYIFTNHLIDFVNGARHFLYVDTWGYKYPNNNSYSGMIGTLQRGEAEIGGTALFITSDRVTVIEFCSMTTPSRGYFIFRPPPLSYMTNIFTLPFTAAVWICSIGLILLTSVLLYVVVYWEWSEPKLPPTSDMLVKSFSDSVLTIFGAVAQQGATNEPRSGAGKIIFFCALIVLMFLYVSYSANIVALLQSSSTSIVTLEDLLNSRLKLGVCDTVYNHYYFKTATEPIRKAIYEKKVAPKGQKPSFISMEEGISRVKEGFFAFHVEVGPAYKLVGDIFLEHEKCGIQEIPYLQVVDPHFAVKKNSSYKEMIKIGLRRIHENGIQSRELQRLYTKKPDCHSSGANFVSVGLLDAYPAFLVLFVGMGLAVLILLSEKIAFKKRCFRYSKDNDFTHND